MFPLPWSSLLEKYSSGTLDAHGNPSDSWASGVETPCFWYSPSSDEPFLAGHDRSIIVLVWVVSSKTVVDPRDRVVILGKRYEVEGEPQDYDHGPFGFPPGVMPVALKRVEG